MKKLLTIKNAIILLIILLIPLTMYNLFIHTMAEHVRNEIKYDAGTQFAVFTDLVKNEEKIGYFTDKNMSSEKNDGTFLMLQYYLAPTIIELNPTGYNLCILDSTNTQFIVGSMIEKQLKRITNNEYGQALFRKKL